MKKDQIGFLAQELEQEFPELVDKPTSEDETYYVNYLGMIPVLLEAIKEQQLQIEDLRASLEACSDTSQTKSMIIGENTQSYLFQNVPNPFDIETEIKYFISEISENAILYVFNLQGILKLQKPIYQKGEGSITIYGSELEAGMYIYTLVVNGKEVDSKRMILTK
jgi:hypothetical protein